MKHGINELDRGQLDLMWNCLKLRENKANKADVRALIQNLDAIRQAIVQMTGGEQVHSDSSSVPFGDVGTHINAAIVSALWLRTSEALEKLIDILPEVSDND